MKNILFNRRRILSLMCFAGMLIFAFSCDNDEESARAVIDEVRNYAASPDDTLVNQVVAGQWLVLKGKNLSKVSQVYFGSVAASVNNTLFTDESIVVQVPSIPFQSIPTDKLNAITVINEGGITTFEITVTGPPMIARLRNFADAPNDTIIDAISPGQTVNIIGYNLQNALSITFQGLDVDISNIIYTDSSAIVTAPEDFSEAGVSRANKLAYTTALGIGTYANYNDPLWTLLAGGIFQEKTWVIDLFKMEDGTPYSKKFMGHVYWAGNQLRFDKSCAVDGGNCWTWEPDWQSWMPTPKDFGTMTFKLKGTPIDPMVTVVQKTLGGDKDGAFTGSYSMDVDEKSITFTDVIPLYQGYEAIWTKAYIISLTEDGMSLGFQSADPNKAEFQVFNYVPK